MPAATACSWYPLTLRHTGHGHTDNSSRDGTWQERLPRPCRHTLLIHHPRAVRRGDAGATTPAPPGSPPRATALVGLFVCRSILNPPFGVVCVVTDIDVGRLGLQGGLYDIVVLAVLEGACRVQHKVSASDDGLQGVQPIGR